jgi:hypothetical protein
VPQFQAAIDAGVLSAMEAFHDIGGVPVVASETYLKRLLRLQMGFDGLLTTGEHRSLRVRREPSDFLSLLILCHLCVNTQLNDCNARMPIRIYRYIS